MISYCNVSKRFNSEGSPAVDSVTFDVADGETLVLLGSSGSGKSTLLKMTNRLIEPTSGRISLDGEDVMRGDPVKLRRKMGYVFQGIGLFPHYSVRANVGIAPRLKGEDAATRDRRVSELLDLVGLPEREYAERFPDELSGGQQQRIALTRAMASKPSLLLMDEPLSSLDEELREQLAREIRIILQQEKISAILVTHDQNEAFAVGDHICVMHQGRVQQNDSAYNLYHHPQNRFVAEFIGEGSLLPGIVTSKDTIATDVGEIKGNLPESCKHQDNVDVLIRPENINLAAENENKAVIKSRYFRGSSYLYTLKTSGGAELLCFLPGSEGLQIDQSIGVQLQFDQPVVFSRR